MKLFNIILFTFVASFTFAQQRTWKSEKSKDGSVSVKYKVTDEKLSNGKEETVIRYEAVTTKTIDLDKVERYLRNSENYKDILDNTEKSNEVSKISENEWLMYLFFDAPWPMPNSDCVQRMTVVRDEGNLKVFGVAKPKSYAMKDVERMIFYDISFEFQEVDQNNTKFTLKASFSPIGNAPEWLLKGWLPEGPARIMGRLISNI